MSKVTIASLQAQVAALTELVQASIQAQTQSVAAVAPNQESMFPAKAPAKFDTKRPNVADKVSKAVTILAVSANEETREILVFCSDNKTRRCKVDRLAGEPSELWKRLKEASKTETEVRFRAAGGFSPDTWFYDFS